MHRIDTLKYKVEKILQEIPETRNSDIALTIEIWKRFYPTFITPNRVGFDSVRIEDMYFLPREDNVKRIRAQFQNDKLLYLPTSLEVVKQRKINEEVWRKSMGQGDVYGRLESIK